MSKKRGPKGKIKNKSWVADRGHYKPTWFEQRAKMTNHEIPE